MEVYLAGGITANNQKFWKNVTEYREKGIPYIEATVKAMQVYLAAMSKRSDVMEVYLAGNHSIKNGTLCKSWTGLNILETFYYLRSNNQFPRLIKDMGNFLLDSGAFTFMSGNGEANADFDSYVEEYAAFINKWDIQNFFELDIDVLVGLQEVERLRYKLEKLTGKKPIPVWHKSRGKDYFVKMCENYPYVSIGGIVTKEIPTKIYERLFPWFIKTAHLHKCKIHGLGYTNIKGLHKYHFDSVDSTAWVYGNISGTVYKFNPHNGMIDTTKRPDGKRLVSNAAAINNFNEWVKFMKYARINL